MRTLVVLFTLFAIPALGQDALPRFILGGMLNADRGAAVAMLIGPQENGYIGVFGGMDFTAHETLGADSRRDPSVYFVADRFPLRTFHVGCLYSHRIFSGLFLGVGGQYRFFTQYIEYRSMTTSPGIVHERDGLRDAGDFVATAGYLFNRLIYVNITWTGHKEWLLGFAVAID